MAIVSGGDMEAGGVVQLARFIGKFCPRVVPLAPRPSIRAMIESAPARRYETTCGKSCARFSKAIGSAEVAVVLKSVSFWPGGMAV